MKKYEMEPLPAMFALAIGLSGLFAIMANIIWEKPGDLTLGLIFLVITGLIVLFNIKIYDK